MFDNDSDICLGSGVVSNLSVPEPGSRWVMATWTKPAQPRGRMTGYVVVALDETQQCVSAEIIRCEDCPENVTADQVGRGKV